METQDNTHETILNTNPVKYIIAGLVVIGLFFGGLAVWSIFFPFQGAVIASGVVKVSGERKKVQHLEGGIIEKIRVREGDLVAAGDPLIELKSSQIVSNVELLQGRLWAKLAEADRLQAEVAMAQDIAWSEELTAMKHDPDVADLVSKEMDIFTYRRSDLQGKIHLYHSQIKQLGNRIEGAREESASVDEIIANLIEDLESKRPLLADQFMGKTDILQLERSLSEYRGRQGKLKQDIAAFQQQIEELRLRIVDIQNQYREAAMSQLGEVKETIFELREQIKPQLDARERLTVRAPISGVVINMRVHSEDTGVISPGMPLLEIVPSESRLVVIAQVRPKDITSVKEGQPTRVQLAAFQRKSTPPVQGKVIHVSPDLILPEQGTATLPHYEVHVEVDPADLAEKQAYLSPGMPVACYITTDTRTVISYLLGPLLRNIDRALRE
ncbi:MAG: HlyD family type I secretion periplasmic adaptor subunit [Desulfotignum sp.]